MSANLRDGIHRDHQRLAVDGAELKRQHETLGQQPFDYAAHAVHIRQLHAHLEELHLYLASLVQDRI